MPFEIYTKTEMFIRCGRLCCLCLKQCGTNIEAAHIIGEKKGGPNDADNGIPVCFDCHQELGAYTDDHPKGNKFHPEELQARRDRVYGLVETGVIYAQVIAERARSGNRSTEMPKFPHRATAPRPSAEVKRFLKVLLSAEGSSSGLGRKLTLFNEQDRAHVLDELVRKITEGVDLIPLVAEIVQNPEFPRSDAVLVTEQIVRAMTLYGDIGRKADVLRTFSDEILGSIYEGLRLAFFEDLINIVKRDQFVEVNKIVPPLVEHVSVVPKELYKEYVFALLSQGSSGAYTGAPAARKALESLPEAVARAGILGVDEEFLSWTNRDDHVKQFVARFGHLGNAGQQKMFGDFVKLPHAEFLRKYFAI